MADEKSVAEQVQEQLNRWNPPEESHAFERVVGVPVDEGDTRATAHVELDEVNAHIKAGGPRPSDSTVDASRMDALDEDEEGEDSGYDDKTVDELKAELRKRDLPVSGKHAELVQRLEEDDASDDDEDDSDE